MARAESWKSGTLVLNYVKEVTIIEPLKWEEFNGLS